MKSLVALDGLHGFVVGLGGVIDGDLILVDVRLKLLLDAEGFSLGALLSLKGGLHGVHGTSVVFASVVELFFLLTNLAVNLLFHLTKFELSTQNLVLLRFKARFSFLQSGLEFFLLNLKSSALFVKFVDGASSISKLVQEILDFISEVLILTADNVELLRGLIKSSLESEPLGIEVATLRVAGIELGVEVVGLGLPFANNLVEVSASLLGDHGSGVGALILHGEFLEFSFHSGAGLLSGGNLGVQVVNGLLGFRDAAGKLVLASFKLIDAAKSLNIVLGFPELDLSLGLGQGLEGVVLLLRLLIDPHAEVLSLGGKALELGEKGGSVASLSVSKTLGVLDLGGEGDLVLLQGRDGILSLLDLAGEILRLDLELLLGGIGFVQGAGQFVELLVGLYDKSLSHLAVLLHVGSIAHGLLKTRSGLLQVSLHTGLVLLGLGLVLVDGVDLLSELRHAVVVLLSEGSKSSFMGDVGLLEIALDLGELSLSLLVELNLGGSVGSSLFKAGSNILEVTGEESPILLSLGAVGTLNGDFLIELINTGLELLDLLGVLGSKSLFVLDLGSNRGDLLLLALDGLGEFSIDSLQIGDGFLSELQVSLDLALDLFNVSLGLLLSLQGILAFVKGLLEFSLDLAEMVALVLHGLDVLLSLLSAFSSRLLLLAKLGDQILLVSDFITEGSDLVVLGHLVFLTLLDGGFESLDFVPQTASLSDNLGSSILDSIDGVVLTLNTGVGSIDLLLQVVSLVLQTVCFVNDVLNGGATRLKSQNKFVLFSREFFVNSNHSVAL